MNPEKKYLQVHYLKVRLIWNQQCFSNEPSKSNTQWVNVMCFYYFSGIFSSKILGEKSRIGEVFGMFKEVCQPISWEACFFWGRKLFYVLFAELVHFIDRCIDLNIYVSVVGSAAVFHWWVWRNIVSIDRNCLRENYIAIKSNVLSFWMTVYRDMLALCYVCPFTIVYIFAST